MCFSLCHPLFGQTNFPKQFVVPQQIKGVPAANGDVGRLIGVGDLNGDGRPDILYTDTEEIATGPGAFTAARLPVVFADDSKLIDVNGDGKLDVVEAVPECGDGLRSAYVRASSLVGKLDQGKLVPSQPVISFGRAKSHGPRFW